MKYSKLILSLAILMFVGMACGTSGPMASEDRTALTGVVLDKDSYDRIADATVRLVDEGESEVTNENGIFTFIGVGVGTHTVEVEAEGYGTSEHSVEVEAGGSRVQLMLE
jgi:hypothetical protein